jgi:hypothetical protein
MHAIAKELLQVKFRFASKRMRLRRRVRHGESHHPSQPFPHFQRGRRRHQRLRHEGHPNRRDRPSDDRQSLRARDLRRHELRQLPRTWPQPLSNPWARSSTTPISTVISRASPSSSSKTPPRSVMTLGPIGIGKSRRTLTTECNPIGERDGRRRFDLVCRSA